MNDIAGDCADLALQQRIETLLAHVHAARAEIIDRGLDAVRVDRELAMPLRSAPRARG